MFSVIFQSLISLSSITLWMLPLDRSPRLFIWVFPGGASGKEPTCQCKRFKRCRFDPWAWKIPWRRAWEPTPVFLPGESHGQKSPVATVHGVTQSQTRQKQLSTPTIYWRDFHCFCVYQLWNEVPACLHCFQHLLVLYMRESWGGRKDWCRLKKINQFYFM